MIVYRLVIRNEEDNVERIREKRMCLNNFSHGDNFYYVSNSNTFSRNRKDGEYLYFFAEDAIRMTQIFKEEWMHNRRRPHVAEFDISTDILAEYLGLGINKSCYGRNLSNNPYYITLEFAIPRKVLADNYRDKDYKYSCITGRVFPIKYFEHFEEAEIPSEVSSESYEGFHTSELPIIMEMLNVGILPPEENYGMRDRYGFSKCADDYPKEEAIKILTKLNGPKMK